MEILLYPNPLLRRPVTPVEKFDAQLAEIAREMFGVMYRTRGIGLAAPQVGQAIALLVFNPTGEPTEQDQERVLVNPRLVGKSKSKETAEEGCLSFPGIYGAVTRPVTVVVEAQDLKGERLSLELGDLPARVVQHEMDHLESVLFIDRMAPADRLQNRPLLEELVARWKEENASSQG